MVPILLLLLAFITFVTFIWLVVAAFKKSPLWGFLVLFLSPITAIIFGIKNWKDAKIPFLAYILSNTVSVVFLLSMAFLMGGIGLEEFQKAQQEFELGTAQPQQQPQVVVRQKPVTKPATKPATPAAKAKADTQAGPEKQGKPAMKPAPHAPKPEMTAAAKIEEQPQTAAAQAGAPAEPEKITETAENELPPPSEEEIEKALEEIEKQEEAPAAPADQQSKTNRYQKISIGQAGKYIGKKVKIIDIRGKEHIGRLDKVLPSRIILEKTTGLIYSYDIQNAAIKTILVKR